MLLLSTLDKIKMITVLNVNGKLIELPVYFTINSELISVAFPAVGLTT